MRCFNDKCKYCFPLIFHLFILIGEILNWRSKKSVDGFGNKHVDANISFHVSYGHVDCPIMVREKYLPLLDVALTAILSRICVLTNVQEMFA